MKRVLPARTALFSIAVILVAILVALAACLQTAARSDQQFQGVLTWHNDNLRTGLNPNETTLTLQNVNSNTFGTLFVISTDGLVDAQPLYVPNLTIAGDTHNVLFVATEHDTAYAFDADNGALLWQVSALGAGETSSDDRNCSEVSPEIGITSTPVIDPAAGPHGTIYLVAMSKDSSGSYHQRLHALDITTGAEQFGGPVDVAANYPVLAVTVGMDT